jgi:hypothetical protein
MELLGGAGRLQGEVYLLRGQRGSFTRHLNSKGHVVVGLCLVLGSVSKVSGRVFSLAPPKSARRGLQRQPHFIPSSLNLRLQDAALDLRFRSLHGEQASFSYGERLLDYHPNFRSSRGDYDFTSYQLEPQRSRSERVSQGLKQLTRGIV